MAGPLHGFDLPGIALVKEEIRVDVAVARVEVAGHTEVVLVGHLPDESQNVRQLATRHHAVLSNAGRRRPAESAEGCLARFP